MENQNQQPSPVSPITSMPPTAPIPEMAPPRKKISLIVIAIIVAALIVIGAGYLVWTKIMNKDLTVINTIYTPPTASASAFAVYNEIPVNVAPQVPAYTVAPDLSNVTNTADFSFLDPSSRAFSSSAKDLLVKNAFVVRPNSASSEFFKLYESNRYDYIPSFITTDSVLHNYHLMFNDLLEKLEEQKLAVELKQLNAGMLMEALSQYNALKGTAWENAAKRNVGFFAVGSKLLDPTVATPSIVQTEVDQELALITAHQEILPSPLMSSPDYELNEDYSQYIPRGHYAKTEQLQTYFKSMMWYGRLTFRFENPDEIKSGILITLALNQPANQTGWDKIYQPINFFVGKTDDINYNQFKYLVKQAYGETVSLQTVATDQGKFSAFVELTKTLEPPQINSMPINASEKDRAKAISGFRFMGQRFTIDAAIFQRLIFREVGPTGVACSSAPFAGGRMLPKGLDIPAAMGSKEALNILQSQGDTEFACYPENMTKMQTYISGLDTGTWTQNLYWGWLYSLAPLNTAKTTGYPTFMQNLAWTRKDLNTYLGSWTELKHDTILYAKQAYAEMPGGGDGPAAKDDRGYVEPNPYLYARMAGLIKMTNEGLDARGLLSEKMKTNLSLMEQLVMSLKTISEKELNNQTLADEEYELIRSYGGQLEHLWLEINQEEMDKQGVSQTYYLQQNPAALVADVATDPNGFVLEEGTGHVVEIDVIVPIDGQLRIARGGVYSYYEFRWPLSDRLTDEKWRDEILGSPEAPALPEWADAFYSK